MANPTLKAEIAFVANPLQDPATLTWTDVTSWVRLPLQIKRGRSWELDQIQAGTCTLTLDNIDGRFDPLNSLSPYNPYVLPLRAIRITATYSGTPYNLFYGFIERWPQSWQTDGVYGEIKITAVDAVKTALSASLPRPLSVQMTQDAAHFWNGKAANDTGYTGGMGAWSNWGNLWGLNTNFTDPSLASDPGQNCLTATFVTNARGAGTTDAYTAATVTGGAPGTFTGQGGADFRFRLVSGDSLGTHQYYNLFMRTATKLNSISIGPSATGPSGYAIYYTVYATATTVTNTPATATKLMDIATGTTYYVALVPHNGSDVTVSGVDVYVNGTLVATGLTEMTYAVNTWPDVLTGRWLGQGNNAAVWPQGLSVKFDTPALYDTTRPLSTTIANSHYAGAVTGTLPRYSSFPQQLTSDRINAILDTIGWPTALRNVDVGATTMIATGTVQGASGLTLMQDAATTELGNLFVDGQGHVVFQNRAHRVGATSAATFGELETPYLDDLEVDFDTDRVYNDVQITQTGSSPTYISEQQDLTSQAQYGVQTLNLAISTTSNSDVIGMTATLLTRYKDPHARIPKLSADGKARPASYPTLLARDIGDLVTVKRRPPGLATMTLLNFVEGVQHNITDSAWVVSFMLTPQYADPTY